MAHTQKKQDYAKKLYSYLDRYTKAVLVTCDNVGSKQFQDIRRSIRGQSVILMGKNTMIKRCLALYMERTGNHLWAPLDEMLVGNVGIIFTEGDLSEVRSEVVKFKVGAAARVGATANCDVSILAGPTGMDPSATNFFQALNIATKINKGTVEIINDVHIIKTGDKVGSSEAALLTKLGIRPFSYGLVPIKVFDNGSIYDPAVLDITDADMEAAFMAGVQNVAAISLALRVPTMAAMPHLIVNGYKNVVAVALETGYSFPKVDKIREILKNPSAFAAPAAAPAKGAAPVAAKKPEPESEEEEEMGFSLFD